MQCVYEENRKGTPSNVPPGLTVDEDGSAVAGHHPALVDVVTLSTVLCWLSLR